MKRFILLSYIICLPFLCMAQKYSVCKNDIDSVVVKRIEIQTKELSVVGTSEEENIEIVYQRKIPYEEMTLLIRKLSRKANYSHERVLLSHADTEILFYANDEIIQKVLHSSLTGNIIILRNDSCVFAGKASPSLHKFINKISTKPMDKQMDYPITDLCRLKCNKSTTPYKQ